MNPNYKLIVHEDIKSPVSEAYRTLRTNLRFAKADALNLIMFTSTGPGEGKSLTAANTAVAMAQTGKKAIVIDCDLRKPVQHRIFGKENLGVTNILVEGGKMAELLQETPIPNLYLLPSGPNPPNPSELLGSAKMLNILTEAKKLADIVIIDAPPTIAVTDACVLATNVDGIVLVVGAGMTRPEMAKQALSLLMQANGCVLGVVLNRVEIEAGDAYYYYYYSDGHTGSKQAGKKNRI
ncbi:exopolysaccharide synthesis protein [Lucifera butyrica]|uniref:non-specific protein-tyrosine kinase n=1 Tax=Lucifera butyrica TaxID=1351585 RepID=A0A498RK35_9FIRM|nr:CpsD/CapB family tyrosine-protein kinase [Lucifera butyrica]VBB09398.1 exopolysaccharide synthesis protein [Lucifera butyrica]